MTPRPDSISASAAAMTVMHLRVDRATASTAALAWGDCAVSSSCVARSITVGFT